MKIYSTKDGEVSKLALRRFIELVKTSKPLQTLKFMVLADRIIFWDWSDLELTYHSLGLNEYNKEQGLLDGLEQFGGGEIRFDTKKSQIVFEGKSGQFGFPEEFPFKTIFGFFKKKIEDELLIKVTYDANYEKEWRKVRRIKRKKLLTLAMLLLMIISLLCFVFSKF